MAFNLSMPSPVALQVGTTSTPIAPPAPSPGIMSPSGAGFAPSGHTAVFEALPAAPPIFGLLVAGRAVTTEFKQAAADKWLAEVPSPKDVSELSIFLLPGMNLPPDKGVCVFYSVPPFATWVALGVLAPSKPSDTLHTGWPTNPDIAGAPLVQIGLSLEGADAVMQQAMSLGQASAVKLSIAQLVARDLLNFMQSFDVQPTPTGDRIMVPPTALSAWMQRFEDRFRRDPNFLLKSASAAS